VTDERLKYVADIRVSNVDKRTIASDLPVRLCNYTDVYYNERITNPLNFMRATATRVQHATFGLRRNDIVLTKDSETPEDIGVSALVSADIPDLVCGYHLAVVRPRSDRVLAGYLRWVLAGKPSRQRLAAAATGVTRFGLRSETIADLEVPVPPLATQRVIADYLDRETTRIDTLIAAKRSLIEKLYEQCDAEIRYAIGESGVVDPEGATVELRRILEKHKDAAPPGTPLVTAYRDGQVTLRELRRAEGYTEAAENSGYFVVAAGDVVLHGLDGFAGAVGTAEASGACSPAYHVLRPLGDADPHYWGRMLRVLAVTGYLALFVTSTRERAYDMRNWEVMGRVPVPVIPIHEQRRIGNVLRRIPALRDVFGRSITLLQEHRQALITAAVTGQLDIPGAV
jgi:type I restriction enzyme, S subunit